MIKVTITRKELLKFKNDLEDARKYKQVKFSYAVIKNLKLIQNEFDSVQELIKNLPSEEFKEYDNKYRELALKYAKKDDNGNPIFDGNTVTIQNMEEFNKEIKDLQEQYKDAIANQVEKEKEFEKFIDEKIEIEVWTVNHECFPQDDTDGFLTENLWNMIKHDAISENESD